MENGAELKRVRMGSLFGHLEMQPPDTVFHVKDRFLADKHPKKVNLGVGGERQNTIWTLLTNLTSSSYTGSFLWIQLASWEDEREVLYWWPTGMEGLHVALEKHCSPMNPNYNTVRCLSDVTDTSYSLANDIKFQS